MRWPRFHTTYHSIQTSFNRRFRDGLSLRPEHTLGLSFTGNTGVAARLQHNADGSYALRDDQAAYEKLLEDVGQSASHAEGERGVGPAGRERQRRRAACSRCSPTTGSCQAC